MNSHLKKIVYGLVLFITTSSLSFAQTGYKLEGKIKGWHDTICFLGNHYGDKKYIKDTTRIDKSGNFVFQGKEKLPGGIYLVIFPNKVYFEIIVDKEQYFSMETDTTDLVKKMKFKKSEENNLFYKYLNFIITEQGKAEPLRKYITRLMSDSLAAATTKKDSIKILQEKSSVIDKEVEEFKTTFRKNYPNTFLAEIFKAQTDPIIPESPTLPNGRKDSTFPYLYYKAHYWDNLPLSDDRFLRTPMFHYRLKSYFDRMVIQNPDSLHLLTNDIKDIIEKTKGNKEMFKYIIWYLTPIYENNPIMGMDGAFVFLVEEYYKTWKAYWVDSTQNLKIIHRAEIIKPLLLGKPSPSVIMQDTSGNSIALYDIKSKYTIVVFWDPDCGHCQKTIPKLREEYDKHLKAKGVTVYSVNIEDNEEKWKKFIRDNKLEWINVHDKFKKYFLRDLFDIYSTPVIYLLDDQKIIKAKRIDVEQIDGFIDHLEKIKELKKK